MSDTIKIPILRPRWAPEVRAADSGLGASPPEAEEWRPLEGLEMAYQVSSLGRVRSPRGDGFHVLSPGYSHDGYAYVMLKQEGRTKINYVHRLVCTAWHGHRPYPEAQAAHLDGYQGNNRPHNLAWVTPSENNRHKALHGTLVRGADSPAARLTNTDVLRAVTWANGGVPRAEVARRLGVGHRTIGDIMAGKTWSWLTKIEGKMP